MMLWPLALLAGAISFTSPCCLPLLPGYLAHVSGLVDPARPALRSRTALALLFVGGFALVFTLLGASLGLFGGALLEQRGTLIDLAGWCRRELDAVRRSSARRREYPTRLGNSWPSVVDEDGRSAIAYGVFGIPETFFIGRDGVIAGRHVGPIDEQTLVNGIEALRSRP